MMIKCCVCGGSGRVPIKHEGPMSYLGPNGESWPMEYCKACGGTGLQEEKKLNKEDVMDEKLGTVRDYTDRV